MNEEPEGDVADSAEDLKFRLECHRQIVNHGGMGLPWVQTEQGGWRLEWGCESITLVPNPENGSRVDVLWESQNIVMRGSLRGEKNMSLVRRIEDAHRWHLSPKLAEPTPPEVPAILSGPKGLLELALHARRPSMCSWVVEQLELLAEEWEAERSCYDEV